MTPPQTVTPSIGPSSIASPASVGHHTRTGSRSGRINIIGTDSPSSVTSTPGSMLHDNNNPWSAAINQDKLGITSTVEMLRALVQQKEGIHPSIHP
jgi:hypothetical protein